MSGAGSGNSSLRGHLAEFQRRLAVMIAAWVLGVLVVFPFSDRLLLEISRPVGRLVFLSPGEALAVRLKLAFIFGALAVLPVWIWQAARFLTAGLTAPERKALRLCVMAAGVMTGLGAVFAHGVLVPVSLRFLLALSGPGLEPMITAGHYAEFYLGIMTGCCLFFNAPCVAVFLGRLGLLSPEWFQRRRRHVYAGCFIAGAVLTPPDVLTQILMAVPLCCLYEITILGLRVFVRRP